VVWKLLEGQNLAYYILKTHPKPDMIVLTIPKFGRLRLENGKFEANLGYIGTTCLKKQN
jgi:hypothetical protein